MYEVTLLNSKQISFALFILEEKAYKRMYSSSNSARPVSDVQKWLFTIVQLKLLGFIYNTP